MMAAPVKSAVRAEIEAEVIRILSGFDRPMSAAEIFVRTETAEDKQQVVRIIGHMREAGTIIRGDDIPVGAPGGMLAKAKAARPVASYRLPTAVERAEIDAAATEAANDAADAIDQVTRRTPPSVIVKAKSPEAVDTASAFAAAYRTLEDIDSAASSTNGDECNQPWANMLADGCIEDHQWESDLLQACETSREALLTIADQLLAGHPVWSAARAVDRALTRLADEYV